MRCLLLLGALCLMASSLAWASNGEPTPPSTSSTKAAQPSPSEIKQRLAQHQVEVKRLEQAVTSQESDSKRASERLQQQDQAIAQLQKQLDALRAKSPASQH